MFKFVLMILFSFNIQITIDVGYYGKKITGQSNYQKQCEFDKNKQFLIIRKYGDRMKKETEQINFVPFRSSSNQEDLQNEYYIGNQDFTNIPESQDYFYLRKLSSFNNYIPKCPFMFVYHISSLEAEPDKKNITMLYHYYSGNSSSFIMMEIHGEFTRNFISEYLLMNLVIYIFNNSLFFDKDLDQLTILIQNVLKDNKVQLELLDYSVFHNLLIENIQYLIKSYHLNASKSYDDLINFFLNHLKSNIEDVIMKNFNVSSNMSFLTKKIEKFALLSVIDICNVISEICGKKFNFIKNDFFNEIIYTANVLERCLICEIKILDAFENPFIIFEGYGDIATQRLYSHKVDSTNTFIIGCNQLYDLYQESIKLKIILIYKSKKIENVFDITNIISVDN